MSPEQVRGLPTDHRSDIFSLGTVLFEMVARQRPFRGDTAADTTSAILREDPPPMPAPGVPPALERIIRRCLEKNPKNRFQSADDLAFALDAPTTITTSTLREHSGQWLPRRAAVVVGTAVLILGGIVAFVLGVLRPAIDLSGYRFTPFAADAKNERLAAWSPDGRSIAYCGKVGSLWQIFVRSVDSDSPVQVTNQSASAYEPFWWPDGSRIGFLSAEKIWSISRAGGPAEVVQDRRVDAAALSSDGQTLATWRFTETGDGVTGSVWIAKPPNFAPRKYEPAPFAVKGGINGNALRFSPDGHTLLLSHLTETAGISVWLLPFPEQSANQPRRLPWRTTFVAGSLPSFTWMPDNHRVVMGRSSPAAPKGGLWMVDTRDGSAILLSGGVTGQSSPAVSPDGTKLAFTSGGENFDLALVPTDGSPLQDLQATTQDEFSAAWIPLSSRYVYVTNKNGSQELRVHNQADDTDLHIVSASAFGGEVIGISAPVSAPGGQRIAYNVFGANGAVAVWISPIGGGAPIKLTQEGATEIGPEWSPDGESIALSSLDGGAFRLAVVRVGRNEKPRVIEVTSTGDQSLPAWSPSGEWIAYATDQGLKLVSPDGTRHRLIGPVAGTAVVWSQNSQTLYTTIRDANGGAELVEVDAHTGASRTVGNLGKGFVFATPLTPGLRFTLTPDGKHFLATILRERTDIWILENFGKTPSLFDRLASAVGVRH
jgi:Tol biopolymer transport system component